ncbi:hypothetical protein BX666DRAFT_458791 [Dichotomocladium elegans]|nr:hypothetical protein BX666DRAFT_458791 [Dichotomocladium elegans]
MTASASSLTLNLVLNLRKFTSLLISIVYFDNEFENVIDTMLSPNVSGHWSIFFFGACIEITTPIKAVHLSDGASILVVSAKKWSIPLS